MSGMKMSCILAMIMLVFAGGIACAVSHQDRETEQKVIFPQSAPTAPTAPTPPPISPLPTPTPTTGPISSMPSEFFLDSDGDGFNDWFEINISKTDPFVPNNRYIVLFVGNPQNPDEFKRDGAIEKAKFFEQEGIPSENIFLLLHEDSTGPNLQKAIEKIAEKSTDNDIVFISLRAHGSSGKIQGIPYAASINNWLNKVKARVVIIDIIACGCESAIPVLKDGPYSRVVFIWYGELFSALGISPAEHYAIEVDSEYGNNDGYVSLKEIANWYEKDWKFYSARAIEEGRGVAIMSDTSGIASQIYLTDLNWQFLEPRP